ncbi:hypothetical protein ACH47Z_18130 [Streptomyces sp. NPDC020192]|uniref:hypothetical protein n=1 Tax=Streptomyces sp. NPDC020192 TaxID=3365066 RepID=UPI00378EFBAE
MNTTPDRPGDAMEPARAALRDLSHIPGATPVRQLRQLGADALEDASQSAPTSADVRLLQAAVTALGLLTETELDEMEQAALAEAFGLDQSGGA